MLFHSSRGKDYNKSFKDIAIQGLASDGGLFIPDYWPQIDLDRIRKCKTYPDVVKLVLPFFAKSSYKEDQIIAMVDEIWKEFPSKELVQIQEFDNFSIAELFHGPTAAFKDFGLQMVSYFLNKILTEQNRNGVILGATSGDTGSAAIHACKRYSNIKTFILLPEGNMSEIQRRQMSTVNQENIFSIKVNGTFDDCQDIVKKAFNSERFLPESFALLSVNSINWIRIIAQICYYFFAFSLTNTKKEICLSVPSGNFGNVFSAYSAFKMGLPVKEICVAVNSNDILHRFFSSNDYSKRNTVSTISPSMDISVASNFERLVYDYYLDRDPDACRELFNNLNSDKIVIDKELFKQKLNLFSSLSVTDLETKALIRRVYDDYQYVVDPHTAIACARALIQSERHVIVMATAHPEKFPDLLKSLNIPINKHHSALQGLLKLDEKLIELPCDYSAIKDFIKSSL
ncbi:MAG: threonine synthase [Gammaproteobacteria bacterium]